jgi:hypothetical protein
MRLTLKFEAAFMFLVLLTISISANSWPTNSRKDGFNELFINSLMANQKQSTLDQLYSTKPGLKNPSTPNLSWGEINYWVNKLATSTPPAPQQSRGSTKLIRDIVHLSYLEPSNSGQTSPFESEIVGVLSIYKAANMKVILAFAMSGQNYADEPGWVTNQVNAVVHPIETIQADLRMKKRVDLYADIIDRFIYRMHTQYGDNAWRTWLKSNVRIEPMNEVNANLSAAPKYAAYLDVRVKNLLAARGVNFQHEVIASSIISGGNYGYLGWYWNTTNYDGYFQSGADPNVAPNIHLYYSRPLDKGSFAAFLNRAKAVVDILYLQAKPTPTPIIIGEIGHPFGSGTDPDHPNEGYDQGNWHNYLVANIIDNPSFIDMNRVDSLAFWRLFGAHIGVSCYNYPNDCAYLQRIQTTLGVVRLPTIGRPTPLPPLAATPLEIEPQATIYYGL